MKEGIKFILNYIHMWLDERRNKISLFVTGRIWTKFYPMYGPDFFEDKRSLKLDIECSTTLEFETSFECKVTNLHPIATWLQN